MIVNLSKKILDKIQRKGYRDAYVAEHVKTGVAYQVRAMRDSRGWSQKYLSELMDKPQSVVSRIEDPEYGKLSVQTILEVASAFDVAVLVQFVGYAEFIARNQDVSPRGLDAPSFNVNQFQPIIRTGYIRVTDDERIESFPVSSSETVITSIYQADLVSGDLN